MSRNLILSLINAIIFVLCILIQLLVAWLSINDVIWILIGVIGISLGIISLYLRNWNFAGIGFGFIMACTYTYIIWLYLAFYGLFAKYGINMPIAILALIGLLISGLIIFFFFKDTEFRGYFSQINGEDNIAGWSGGPLEPILQILQLITAIITLIVAIISLIIIFAD